MPHILQQPFLVFVDGDGRCGVTRGQGQKSRRYATIGNQSADSGRNVVQGDAGSGGDGEGVVNAEHRSCRLSVQNSVEGTLKNWDLRRV